MESRGGVTGGPTLTEFLQGYASAGYEGSFVVRDGGRLECCACHRVRSADAYALHSVRRVEGVSDPADMGIIAALECTSCRNRGTAALAYGMNAGLAEAEVLRRLDHGLRASQATWASAGRDLSLVRDSGWLRGPDG